MKITVQFRSFLLKFCNISNVLELGFGEPSFIFTTEPSQYVPGFLFSADLNKPTRGLREEPDDHKQEEQWNDLKGDRESPHKWTVTAANV